MGLRPSKLEILEYGALLHDVGKMGTKKTIQEHPLIGVKILGRNKDSDMHLSKRGRK